MRSKVTLLLFGMCALLALIGSYFGGFRGALLGAGLALALFALNYFGADGRILRAFKVREITDSNSRIKRSVANVSRVAGIMEPRVYVAPSKSPNAFATGRTSDNASIVLTEGLLETLSPGELEGVIGHELAHIANRDTALNVVMASMAGSIGMLAGAARYGALFRDRRNNSGSRMSAGAMFAAMALAPIAAMLIQFAVSRSREFKADADGAGYTNRYSDLASALQKIESSPMKEYQDAAPHLAHLFIHSEFRRKSLTTLFSTHPPIAERIERLHRLAVTGGNLVVS